MQQLKDPRRPWYSLTLPGTQKYTGFPQPRRRDGAFAADPLRVWPEDWDNQADGAAWDKALDWSTPTVHHTSVVVDVAFDKATINYAFNNLYDYIPCTRSPWTGMLGFRCEDNKPHHEMKMRNFYCALKHIQHYPTGAQMQAQLGVSKTTFANWIQPTIYSLCRNVDFIDWNLR